MEKRRIFIAINLPEEVKKELYSYSKEWPELPGKWTAKDNLHITLEFLGDLTDEELAGVCVAVKKAAEGHESFSLRINQVVYGPPKKVPPRFIWAVGEESRELTSLKKDLEESLVQKISFVPEERSFAPHITLARINTWEWKGIEPEERPEINKQIDLTFTVESIEVMESELKRGGPIYTILESHQLK